jgi:hypothetical protein
MVITYKFSGHESFPCKSLWLKKGDVFVVQKSDACLLLAILNKKLYDYPQLAVQKFGRIPENAYLCTKFEIPLQDEAI